MDEKCKHAWMLDLSRVMIQLARKRFWEILRSHIVITMLCGFQNALQTPLCSAALYEHTDVARLLLQHGADLNHQVSTADACGDSFGFNIVFRIDCLTLQMSENREVTLSRLKHSCMDTGRSGMHSPSLRKLGKSH